MNIKSPDPAGPPHVLVVDDEESLRDLVAVALRGDGGGFFVSTAENGEEALAIERATCVDLVILDLGLPDMHGHEVLRRLQASPGRDGRPILVITGDDTPASRVAAAEAGATDVLGKPFTLSELVARVRGLLRLAEFQRRASERLARFEERERLKTSLVQMIVHDQSNLVTALLGYIDLLAEQDLPDEQRRWIRAASGVARDLRSMTLDILDVDRLEENRMPVEREPVELARLLADVVDEARVVSRKGRSIALEMPDRLPSIRGDEQVLARVLRNLLSNALKYTGDAGCVFVHALQPSPGELHIAVEDDGPGVPPELREKIFEKFGAAEARTVLRRRTRGLGLAFSRLAARAHGGEIVVEDRPGGTRGARFVLRLPAEPCAVRPAETAATR